MKTRKSILFLLLASVIILTSMSQCYKEDWERIDVELNWVPYHHSSMNFYPTGGRYQPVFRRTDEGFSFEIRRNLSSEYGPSVTLSLSMDCDEPFKLYRQYPFDEQGKNEGVILGSFLVEEGSDKRTYEIKSFSSVPGGYVEFTEYDEVCLSGRFEFTAVNSELDSVIYVTGCRTFRPGWESWKKSLFLRMRIPLLRAARVRKLNIWKNSTTQRLWRSLRA